MKAPPVSRARASNAWSSRLDSTGEARWVSEAPLLAPWEPRDREQGHRWRSSGRRSLTVASLQSTRATTRRDLHHPKTGGLTFPRPAPGSRTRRSPRPALRLGRYHLVEHRPPAIRGVTRRRLQGSPSRTAEPATTGKGDHRSPIARVLPQCPDQAFRGVDRHTKPMGHGILRAHASARVHHENNVMSWREI